jgi:Ni,Fe-hydrogenase III large subunit
MTGIADAVVVAPEALGHELAGALGDKGRLAVLFLDPGDGDGDGDRRADRLVGVVAKGGELAVVRAPLRPGQGSYPSVTLVVPAADWYEREVHDLYGIVAEGHPDLDPLVLPRAPATAPPARGSMAGGVDGTGVPVEVSEEPLPQLVHGEGLFTMPYGPVRSGVFEAVEYVLETPGEDIPRLQTRPHYKHRGVEAAFVGRDPDTGVLVAERVEAVASVAHALAFCQALERLGGVEVPRTGELVRVVHAELERLANHLDSTARHAEGAGQAVAFARVTLHKERVLRLRAELCGSRFGRGVVVPGGVATPPLLAPADLLGALDRLEGEIRDDLRLLMTTPSFLDRLRGTGQIPTEVMVAHGGLGPLGRGSGAGEDVRVARPYGAYRRLGIVPSLADEGDALARQRVRNEEMASSFHLLRQAVDGLRSEAGRHSTPAWAAAVPRVDGEALGWAEAAQGEVLTYVRIEGGRLRRVKPRSASFHNLGLFTAAFPKDITTDFAFIEASFGLSIAGAAG